MDSSSTTTTGGVKKQEDLSDTSRGEKRDIKPVKTLNRVPRACNACRKQKMRCEGADNPPCRRCRHAGLDCLFEKPSREATLTGEAGLERIRSLENHVAEIRLTQSSIQSTLVEIVGHLRNASNGYHGRSPSAFPSTFHQHSPSMQSVGSPAISTPPGGSGGPHVGDTGQNMPPLSAAASSSCFSTSHGTAMNPSLSRHSRGPPLNTSFRGPSASGTPVHGDYQAQPFGNYPSPATTYHQGSNSQGPVLPPFSSIAIGTTGAHQNNLSPVRYHPTDNNQGQRYNRHHEASGSSGSKRPAPSASNVTSAYSSDHDSEDEGELPASGLVAPWEVLRGLADVAIQQAAKENGDSNSSEPQSRARTPTPERQSRPTKRRKFRHKVPRALTFPDVVTKNIITDSEARDLFRIFYHGCSTFLPVFDQNTDTYDALHERSPFAVDCICMVAARVRGGGKETEIYTKCLEEVQTISCATLFSPVTRSEAVQSMILVSGWSDNGWLSGGHAVRMAMELSMHQAWPKLQKRMRDKISGDSPEDQQLVVASRTWFCLYLFEHQLSYGTGRPAVLKDDESIWQARMFLQHPLAIEDDMRLVSTVELMAIRERVTNNLGPYDKPVGDDTFDILKNADQEFQSWFKTWDQVFSRRYEDAAFYRQSLQIQHFHAALFHNATALRGINGPEDVQNMPEAQKNLAIRSIHIALKGLDVTVNSPSYREGMKYAVHYTHATATFSASFLLRLARLFPRECDLMVIRKHVEQLASLMSEIPGKRYALTLQLMLKRSKRRQGSSHSRSPRLPRDAPVQRSISMAAEPQGVPVNQFSSTYDPYSNSQPPHSVPMAAPMVAQPTGDTVNAEHIWRGFETTANEQLPMWLSDSSLGGHSFQQGGMDAFLLPSDYLPPAPQIW